MEDVNQFMLLVASYKLHDCVMVREVVMIFVNKMDEFKLNSPVVFFIFKRAKQTSRVFQAITQARPSKLYIVADGPRNKNESEDCQLTRKIVDQVDWGCTVYRNYSNENLGVRDRIITGLDWVFEREEKAIVLEDDCLPHSSFFRYCEGLLDFYEANPQVMHISGDNFLFGAKASKESYYFSKYAHVWGWATWKRAWNRFHQWNFENPPFDMRIFQSDTEKAFWLQIYHEIKSCQLDYTWDYQWSVVCMAYRSLCAMPNVNLVSNIGFGEEATNTRDITKLANIPVHEMSFPLVYAKQLQWNKWADEQAAQLFFHASSSSILSKLKSFIA